MMQSRDVREYFILASIFIYTCWASVQGFILHFDAAGRIPNMMVYLSLFMLLGSSMNKFLRQFAWPILLWSLWVIYTVINTGIQSDMVNGIWSVPFFAFLLTGKLIYFILLLVMLQQRRQVTLGILTGALFTSCLLFCFYGRMDLHGSQFQRLLSSVINANEIAFSGVVLAALGVFWLLRTPTRWLPGLSSTVLATVLVTMTASRTAFVCLVPLLSIGVWSLMRKYFSFYASIVIGVLVILSVSIPAWNYIEEKTVVGQRLQYREQEVENLKLQYGIMTTLLWERAVYFYDGLELWERFPYFGVGYGNYIFYSRSNTRCHIEYMAQLSEGGLAGAFIYALFILTLLLAPFKHYRSDNRKLTLAEKTLAVGALMAIFMFNIGLFTSMQNDFYILCALVYCVFYGLPAAENKSGELAENPIG